MLGTLFTLPNSTDMLAGLGAYSSPIFTEFLPFLYLVAGITIGLGVLFAIINYLIGHLGKH